MTPNELRDQLISIIALHHQVERRKADWLSIDGHKCKLTVEMRFDLKGFAANDFHETPLCPMISFSNKNKFLCNTLEHSDDPLHTTQTLHRFAENITRILRPSRIDSDASLNEDDPNHRPELKDAR